MQTLSTWFRQSTALQEAGDAWYQHYSQCTECQLHHTKLIKAYPNPCRIGAELNQRYNQAVAQAAADYENGGRYASHDQQ
ncbi:hypothetical protein SAMN05660443_0229 [Marinospirillum celere]|uniref:Uncharacterized protein n=1 Tax=Marinospirillum celere TaxID=1122252 RepID=A0A1I1E155_9GAMM|nr:hypothetical protein [Marinospirillum celere]SFB80392.1 hypothetical protein SAMN05660443_0229 [Marinospirillum celere]